MRCFPPDCAYTANSNIIINRAASQSTLSQRRSTNKISRKTTIIVSSLYFHHFSYSCNYCRKISSFQCFKVWIKTILCIDWNFINSSKEKFSFTPDGSNNIRSKDNVLFSEHYQIMTVLLSSIHNVRDGIIWM